MVRAGDALTVVSYGRTLPLCAKAADEVAGEVLTRRFENVGGVLQINFVAPSGAVRVEVLDKNGQAIPGYGRDQCEPLTGNSVRGAVNWKTKRELPTGAPVRFRLTIVP